MKASEYNKYKEIRKESLRDNMSDIEVALTDLGEIATRELAKEHRPLGLNENKKVAKAGGEVAKTVSKSFKRGFIYKYQEPESKRILNEITMLLVNSNKDCKLEF